MPNDNLPPTENAPQQPTESILAQQPPVPTDWRATLPPEIQQEPTLGRFKDPGALAQSYLELTRWKSNANKIVVPGADASPELWNEAYKALGRPDDPAGYELKPPEGAPIQAEALPEYAKVAHKAGLSKAQAAELVNWFGEHAKAQQQTMQAQAASNAEAGIKSLQDEWGHGFTENLAAAQRAVQLYGGPALLEELTATGLGNYPALVKAFANIGKVAKEHGLPAGVGVPGTMTKEMAQAQIQAMESDPDTRAALLDPMHPKHQLARKERHSLRLVAQGG